MTALRDLSADDISALSGILAKLRPHGAPRWQPAGVRASLAKVANLNAADVLMAAARLSQDRSADSPGQIAITSAECWREKIAEPSRQPRVLSPAERCGICSKSRAECAAAPRFADDDHTFEPDWKHKRPGEAVALIVADVKAEVAPTAPPPEPRSLDDFTPNEHADAAREVLAAQTATPPTHTTEPEEGA